MPWKVNFHRHHNGTKIEAYSNGQTVWIDAREGAVVATLFLDPDQADQIEALLATQRLARHAAEHAPQEAAAPR